jgi:general secretion pathway protein K
MSPMRSMDQSRPIAGLSQRSRYGARNAVRPRRLRVHRGAALLMVLWLIALMTAVVGAFAMTARIEHLQGKVLSQGVVADQAARAGLEYAMTRVTDVDQTRQWLPDGRPYRWPFGNAEVTVKITDETGKVDLNAADLTLLAGLIQAVSGEGQGEGEGEQRDPLNSAGREEARKIASAILDWRDPDSLSQAEGGAEDAQYAADERPYGAKDGPFETVGELELVLGMTPELFAKLLPHLTVYSGQPQPNQAYASGEVLNAMGLNAEQILEERLRPRQPGEGGGLVGVGTGTYSIDSRARLRDGRVSVLRAVVRAGNSGLPGSAYTPLRWDEGALPR